MNTKMKWMAALMIGAAASVGCKSSGGDSSATGGETKLDKRNNTLVKGEPIPADHPFAKLTYGMGTTEVRDIAGSPTDEGANITGKTFNPFYYGTDTNHQTWYYKGQGRLTFNSHQRLIEVRYNPDERGYR